MAGDYAVTITVSRTAVEPGELAARLADLLDRPAAGLEDAIRGEVAVLERGLSYREATEIQRQLGRREIPSQVVSGQKLSGDELSLETPGEAEDQESGDDGREESGGDEPAGAGATPDRAVESGGREETDDPEEPATGAWGELFPDLAEEEMETAPEEGADDGALSASGETDGEVAPVGAEPDGGDGGEGPAGFQDLEEQLMNVDQKPPESDDSSDSGGTFDPGVSDADRGPGDSGSPGAEPPGESGDFDPGKIRRAIAAGDDEPPYKPDGYDRRTPHIPLLAALLSLFAPGAGQLYNGRPEKARRYAWTFFLVYPWYKSIREAWEYGEKIRTYYAPRPEQGQGRRVVMFGVKWWFVVVTLAGLTGLLTSELMEYREREAQRQVERTLQQMRFAGEQDVAAGVYEARKAAEQAAEELDEQPGAEGEFTMDDEERARRLFILGYHYCKGGEYELCDQMMNRVARLAPDNRDAYDIQTWANLRAQGLGEDREMPDVEGQVPSLERFEVELAAEGRDLEDIDREFGTWWNTEGQEAVAERESDDQDGDEPDGAADQKLEEQLQDFEIGE